ncbi:hypothetical protein [Dactylosporangium sp. NPDC005555]|uniref:hypothetical protein n=1 Tax=Dactylosporangium sp. NPDC005555 TaxID=3154889 RepID=UPI0033B95EBE
MRTNWRHAGAVLVIGGAAAVTVLVLAAMLYWQHDERPWPLLVWAGVKGLLWSKGVFKLAVAAGLGVVIAVRAVARRLRRAPADGASR